jgi:hypothetical protein
MRASFRLCTNADTICRNRNTDLQITGAALDFLQRRFCESAETQKHRNTETQICRSLTLWNDPRATLPERPWNTSRAELSVSAVLYLQM